MIGQPVALLQIPNQRLFGIAAAAQYLRISVESLRTYADLGLIRARRLRKRRVFKLEDLDAFIDSFPEYASADTLIRGGKPRRTQMGDKRHLGVLKRCTNRRKLLWPSREMGNTSFRRNGL